jgi:hypothetical protein
MHPSSPVLPILQHPWSQLLNTPFNPAPLFHPPRSHRPTWLQQLAVTHHVGNNVATARGPNPPTQFESMPIYVRLGMHLLYVGKEQEKLLGSSKINALLKEVSLASYPSSNSH